MTDYKFYTQEEDTFVQAYPTVMKEINRIFSEKQLSKDDFYFGEGISIALDISKEILEIYYINQNNDKLSLSLDIIIQQSKIESIDSCYGEDN